MRHRLTRQSSKQTGKRQNFLLPVVSLCLLSLLLAGLLSACDSGNSGQQTLTAANQSISYSTKAQDVIIRTFYGGGLYGSFSPGPLVSVYGDGTYILGLDRQGKLSADDLQKLLSTLLDTYGLLNLNRQHFSDMPDQNATYLELSLNGKHYEFAYGTFGSQPQSKQDLDEYERLGKAITALNDSLTGTTHAYTTSNYALLARQSFNPDGQVATAPDLGSFTLAQAALYTCGDILDNVNTPQNRENGCLKYTVPQNALLLTSTQVQTLKSQLGGASEGTFQDGTNYYSIVLRPMLPDELATKQLAMFGSSQSTYKPVPLHEGAPPQ